MQSLNLRQVAEALPSSSSKPKLDLKSHSTAASRTDSPPPTLPPCFEPIISRATSTLAHHRLQRSTLESVALTLPPSAHKLTGSSAAAVYMAALVTSLNRLISTSSPIKLNHSRGNSNNPIRDETKINRKDASKNRLEETRREQQITNMSIHSLIAPETKLQDEDKSMMLDDKEEKVKEEIPQLVGIITSFISLISLSLQDCTHAIINLKANDILSCIIKAYNHADGYVTIAHHSNTVFASVLSVLSSSSWSSSMHVQMAFVFLLRHTCDELDESFRDNSCKILNALFYCPRNHIIISKTSSLATKYYTEKLNQCMKLLLNDEVLNEKERSKLQSNLLIAISSLENYKSFFLPKDLTRIISHLTIIAIKDIPEISPFAYSTLSSIFSVRNADNENNTTDDKSPIKYSDLSKLLNSIMNHNLPEDCIDEIVVSYISCVASGTLAFIEGHDHVSPPDEFIYRPVGKLYEAIELSIGKHNIIKGISKAFQIFLNNQWFIAKPKIVETLSKFLDKKFYSIWSLIIPILRKYLETGKCSGNEQMKSSIQKLIKNLLKIREKGFKEEDRKQIEVCENVLKSISRGGGTTIILNECPIRYDKKDHITNGWILSILKDNIINTQLSSFVKYLVPIGQKLDATMKEKLNDKRIIEAKNIAIYKLQIWSLLPGFCTDPMDLLFNDTLTLAFKAIHLCFTVDESENLFSVGVQALKQLSNSILKLDLEDPVIQSKVQGFVLRFKKLYPILNNVILKCHHNDEKKNGLLNTIRIACKATHNQELITSILRKTIKQLLELQLKISSISDSTNDNIEEEDDKMKDDESANKKSKEMELLKNHQQVTADLAITIMESKLIEGEAAEIEYLEKAMNTFFVDKKENSLQKKAYRLSTILINDGIITKDYEKFMKFIQSISETSSTLAVGAKASRMAWIKSIINQHLTIDAEHKPTFLDQLNDWFLSEIILCTRDASEKCRTAAYDTLTQMARAWYHGDDDFEGLKNFFLSVCTALGGKSSFMLAACLSCIGKLIETFRYEITRDQQLTNFVDSLFVTTVSVNESDDVEMNEAENKKISVEGGPVAILMKHESVEVQRAAVAVVKIATKCCSEVGEERLKKIVGGILPGLVHVAENSNKKETRLKVRLVIERLMRKCGFELVEEIFPAEHKKLYTSIRKQYMRERNKKFALKQKRILLQNEKYSPGDEHVSIGNDGYIPEDDDDDNNDDEGEDDDDDDDDVENELIEGEVVKEIEKKRSSNNESDVVNLLENKAGLMNNRKINFNNIRNNKNKDNFKLNLKNKNKEIKYSEDGKPIFVESDNESGGAEAGSADENDKDDDLSDDDNNQINKKHRNRQETSGKRRFDERDGGGDRNAKKAKGSFGEEYRGRRGGGDVKRANRPDPFAYVPLGPSMFAAGSKPGTGGKRSRGTALDQLSSRKKQVGSKKGKGGRSGLPPRR